MKIPAISKHCKAKHFAAENPQDVQFSSYCHKGKINLPPTATRVSQKFLLEKYCRFKNLQRKQDNIIMLWILQVWECEKMATPKLSRGEPRLELGIHIFGIR